MSKPVITSTSGTLIIEDPSDDEMEEDDVEYSPPLVTRHESFDNIPSIYDAFKSKQQVHTNKNFTNQSSLSAFLSPDYCNGVAVSYDNQTLATNASFIEPFPSSSYDDRVVIVLDLANIG